MSNYFIVQQGMRRIGFIVAMNAADACKKVKSRLIGNRVMIHPSLGCMNIYQAEAFELNNLQKITWGPVLIELIFTADEE